MCSSGDSRRAEAGATDGDALSGFHSWGAEAALSLFARESSGTARGEERCAGSFWTNGVRGDASEMVASVLQTASHAHQNRRRSSHNAQTAIH